MKYFLTPIILLVGILVNAALFSDQQFWDTIALLYVDLGLFLSAYLVIIVYWIKKTTSAEKMKRSCLFIAYVGLGIIIHGIYTGVTGNYFLIETNYRDNIIYRYFINTLGREYGAWAPATLYILIGASAVYISLRKLVSTVQDRVT